MTYRLIDGEEAVKESLRQASSWLGDSHLDDLSITHIAFDEARPALSFVIGHGGFSDPATIYALHTPSLRIEFSVYSNPFSSELVDIEWGIPSDELRFLEHEINKAIYEAWLCFSSKWGKRKENSSMSASRQGRKIKIIAS